VAWNFVAKY